MSEKNSYTKVVLEHYRREAERHGKDTSSTMRDEITRGREVAGVIRVLEWLEVRKSGVRRALDIGCGNGYLLHVLRERFPELELAGAEYTPEMCALARSRATAGVTIQEADVRALPYKDGEWDAVVTERCIINVMDVRDQVRSLREVARVLRKGGYFVCIEAFTDGLAELNAARAELGMPPNVPPHHNIWFDKEWFLRTIASDFEVVDLAGHGDPTLPSPNFLSSHYFISRVLYPAVTKADIAYNTHLVKFFSFLPPQGNYSPIQFYLLKRR
ncbi:MAG TPA: class I SAM-dependent methyltransferase [Burkholderiales bacterium]|nr:class I SAM-dependent methyltransferase [Burkholderiales bacterium]